MSTKPTVSIVDDDILIRILLREVLEAAGYRVETHDSAETFLATFDPDNPGCIILDVFMPGIDGLQLQKLISAEGNISPVIFLSAADEVPIATEAMRTGAVDFLQKPVVPELLLQRVEDAMEADMKNRYEELQRSHLQQLASRLTPRELEVVKWLVRGKSNKAIALILGISSRTVEIHRKNAMEKMQADSLADLVRTAMLIDIN